MKPEKGRICAVRRLSKRGVGGAPDRRDSSSTDDRGEDASPPSSPGTRRRRCRRPLHHSVAAAAASLCLLAGATTSCSSRAAAAATPTADTMAGAATMMQIRCSTATHHRFFPPPSLATVGLAASVANRTPLSTAAFVGDVSARGGRRRRPSSSSYPLAATMSSSPCCFSWSPLFPLSSSTTGARSRRWSPTTLPFTAKAALIGEPCRGCRWGDGVLRYAGSTTTRWMATGGSAKDGAATAAMDASELRRRVEEAMELTGRNVATVPPQDRVEAQIADLERESSDPSFWDDPNAPRTKRVNAELSRLTRLLDRLKRWDDLRGECDAALSLLDELSGTVDDEDAAATYAMIADECRSAADALIDDARRFELERLLGGPYDDKPARVTLNAGAGGTEACDWVEMLLRMYRRHAEKMGYAARVEQSSPGDVVGYKSVEIVVDGGQNAYGWFRGEKGAHRLVRLSPFNANNKRQTTFAGVDVAPILDDEEVADVDVPESELEVTTMRSGGKGGQNVNKVESGVRIKHLPSGISVKCTQERSQAMNRDIAMKRLKGQLLAIAQEQRCAEVQAIRGDAVEAAWGAQIRNYVMQPYKMVKDQRSGWETSDVHGFLDGDLEDCIGALLRTRAREEQEAREEERV